jgi:aspartate/methionine/tyrosine aminotransferase
MTRIPTRRERRGAMKYQGILKMKSKFSLSKWMEFTKESIKGGNDIFKANAEAAERSIADQLEQKELKMIEEWKEQGYSASEIEKLREAYATFAVRDLSTWHTDKKVARNLIKEVNKSRAERVNG